MLIHEQIAQETPLVLQARELAVRYGKPFTVWRDGDYAYVRCGIPAEDEQAQREGWQWMSITYPPKDAQS